MKKKALPGYFWLGCLLLYGYTFFFMILEMNVEGMTYAVKIGGAPASFLYNGFIGVIVMNVFLSWLWYYMPEKADKEGGNK
jgi:hypothetical protein